jgi:hypothetical protein
MGADCQEDASYCFLEGVKLNVLADPGIKLDIYAEFGNKVSLLRTLTRQTESEYPGQHTAELGEGFINGLLCNGLYAVPGAIIPPPHRITEPYGFICRNAEVINILSVSGGSFQALMEWLLQRCFVRTCLHKARYNSAVDVGELAVGLL